MWYNFWHLCPTIHCLFSKRVKTDNKPKDVSIIKCSLTTWTDMNMDTTWKTGVIISISCHKVMIMISMTADQLSSIFCWVAWNCPLLTDVLYIIHTVALAIDPLIQSVHLWVSAHLEICLGIKTAYCLGQVYILTYLNSKQSLSEVYTHTHARTYTQIVC